MFFSILEFSSKTVQKRNCEIEGRLSRLRLKRERERESFDFFVKFCIGVYKSILNHIDVSYFADVQGEREKESKRKNVKRKPLKKR